jgi:hypothetical protein
MNRLVIVLVVVIIFLTCLSLRVILGVPSVIFPRLGPDGKRLP